MATSIEIEVEPDEKCNGNCMCGGQEKPGAMQEPSKDALLAELKKLLAETGTNGLAERQMKIDELISKINEMSSGD
jgi:hypothetical protein